MESRVTFRSRLLLGFSLLFFTLATASAQTTSAGWPTYGGNPGGQRYTTGNQITRANLSQLAPAWTFHTGSVAKQRPGTTSSSFEATPILFHGLLYVTSPYDEIFAIDPVTGAGRWQFDPKIQRNLNVGIITSRGVASWASSTAQPHQACASRIFVATMDTRLIAVDAAIGKPCTNFGVNGEVDLAKDVYFQADAPYYNSSPPTVVGNVVIVGSGIVDNTRVDLEDGVVRAFDCRSGKLVWRWEPIPWARNQKLRTGAANAWSVLSADPEHGLVFVPTGAASPDFYGGTRPGDDRDANSVVALEAATGKRVWGFQVVHHDLWDYDVAAEPLLFTFRGTTPAIAITTKQGLIFVLNRLTGEPLYPVTERPVPASDVPGETASTTQPFQDIATLSPLDLPKDAMLGATPEDNEQCRKAMSKLRYDGIYTPPSLRGTLAFPGNIGGVNWGGASIDPATGILYANTNRHAFSITFSKRLTGPLLQIQNVHRPKFNAAIAVALLTILILLSSMTFRRSFIPGKFALVAAVIVLGGGIFLIKQAFAPEVSVPHFGKEAGTQFGTPYTVLRQQIIAKTSKRPCTVMPFGTTSAVNLNTGKAVWQTPLGTLIPGQHTGTLNLGGDVVTAGGLVFTGASEEPILRAFDAATGEELWKGALPVPAQSTPMSYTIDGRQYIVIAAGGHGLFGTPISDALVAFALPAK
jgi:quinoprotein glucose dehydrogenase